MKGEEFSYLECDLIVKKVFWEKDWGEKKEIKIRCVIIYKIDIFVIYIW